MTSQEDGWLMGAQDATDIEDNHKIVGGGGDKGHDKKSKYPEAEE